MNVPTWNQTRLVIVGRDGEWSVDTPFAMRSRHPAVKSATGDRSQEARHFASQVAPGCAPRTSGDCSATRGDALRSGRERSFCLGGVIPERCVGNAETPDD